MSNKQPKRRDASRQRNDINKGAKTKQGGMQSEQADAPAGEELSGEGTPGLTLTGGGGHA
jgi:hypothetical protein